MGKLAIAAVGVALVVAGVGFAAGIDGSGGDRGLRTSSSSTTTTTGTTTTGTTTTEHRADDHNRRGNKGKRAKQQRRGRANQVRNRVREAGDDVRGPCDEAEHANDPRCTGAAADDGRGRSGRGRSGGNSGPG